jgi:L-galactono-1,4-lactone dehydrogenase
MKQQEIRKHHARLLHENKHLRYMWIPHTDYVVVITCNPLPISAIDHISSVPYSEDEKLSAARNLLRSLSPKLDFRQLSYTQLRSELLALEPDKVNHVKKVNGTDAYYWLHNENVRIDDIDRILIFDCGGDQWVSEVALPCGTLKEPNLRDIDYVEQLLRLIKENNLPAHSPIEQRWTAASSAFLSPAYSKDPDTLFSWVGIIMYLPEYDNTRRPKVTEKFEEYTRMCRDHLWTPFGAKEHWAKLEYPKSDEDRQLLYQRLHKNYPIHKISPIWKQLDPKGILANHFVKFLFKE